MKNIEVCLSPELIHLYELVDKTVVIVDIFRATSCMTTGMAHGVAEIKPFASLEECRAMKDQGYVTAGERGGKKVEDFDMGNSPFGYMDEKLKGKKIAVTTTNGTVAIEKSKGAREVIIGSFLNKNAIVKYLIEQPNDILIVCAGWKGRFSLEDTLFAGALVESLYEKTETTCDSALAAQMLYDREKNDLFTFLNNSAHAKRLSKIGITKDIAFCLEENKYDVVPVLKNGAIRLA